MFNRNHSKSKNPEPTERDKLLKRLKDTDAIFDKILPEGNGLQDSGIGGSTGPKDDKNGEKSSKKNSGKITNKFKKLLKKKSIKEKGKEVIIEGEPEKEAEMINQEERDSNNIGENDLFSNLENELKLGSASFRFPLNVIHEDEEGVANEGASSRRSLLDIALDTMEDELENYENGNGTMQKNKQEKSEVNGNFKIEEGNEIKDEPSHSNKNQENSEKNIKNKEKIDDDLNNDLAINHKIPVAVEPEFHIPDIEPFIYSHDLKEFNNYVLKSNEELNKLYHKSTNFYQLILITENLFFNKENTKILLNFIEIMKEKQNSKIIKHFKNIASLKRFRKKLFSKLKKMRNSFDDKHDGIKWEKKKGKYQTRFKLVKEAINKGLMHVLYAKEFCARIDELYKKESIKFSLNEYCKNYVEEIANLILDYANIKFSLNEELNDEKRFVFTNSLINNKNVLMIWKYARTI
uniref:Uncharacterized protein n=1 Tax=Meloidogyne incognita TaxID=6306 RepID=A0A914NDV0_MELIC